ncbi:serine/threonine protein phosphatase [Brevibacillus parabrevis]|uniref:serine/threonine protein phosphatase n=1 Tax=Brevibacillus parabrevis TaxID=54914 RepID=UPI0023808E37|nr:serine/threonine protein phosphatase [Brevibacillus parabrevis]WDV94091.1 serine/threonine protein phosphatase [Brevibacillus parabrevis]
MRRDNSEFVTGFLSESGTHVRNKDYFAYTELDDIACWVIARGLDADQEVQSAELAVKSVLGHFMQKPSLSRYRISRYLQEAHRVLRQESHRVRLKASLTLIVTDYARVVYGVAGNTRLYMFRNGRLHLRSKDQSLSQQMADGEEIAEDVLDCHEERHNLLNYLGTPDEFRPYISKKLPLYDGDVLLLTTPGVWEGVGPAEMQDALEEAKDPEALIDTVEDVLLSKQQRVVNNYTAAAIFANKIFKTDPQKKWRIIKRVAIIVLLLALTGGGALLFKMKEAERIADAATGMFEHEQNGDAFIEESDYPKALKEYSEARNAANIVKDKIHAALLNKKQRITQLIVDGDTAMKDEQYQKALEKYDKALKEMKGRDDFNEPEIAAKKEKTESYLLVMQWKKEGDMLFEAQDYEGAAAFYQKARKLALESSYLTGEKEIRAKLDEVEAKKTGISKEQKMLSADKLEKKGDDSYAAGDFAAAIESYTMAQEMYQEIGVLEKVLAMERKVTKVEEKLNPPAAVPVVAAEQSTPQVVPSAAQQQGGNAGQVSNTTPATTPASAAQQQAGNAGQASPPTSATTPPPAVQQQAPKPGQAAISTSAATPPPAVQQQGGNAGHASTPSPVATPAPAVQQQGGNAGHVTTPSPAATPPPAVQQQAPKPGQSASPAPSARPVEGKSAAESPANPAQKEAVKAP